MQTKPISDIINSAQLYSIKQGNFLPLNHQFKEDAFKRIIKKFMTESERHEVRRKFR